MKDYKILADLGAGILVIDNKNEIPTVGSLVNHKRGKRKQKDTPATSTLKVVGMDIGYGESNSPGGHKYVLVSVDKCTSKTFVYGMYSTSGADVGEALWKFFINTGRFPCIIQYNLNPQFIGGKAISILWSHGCYVRAAPPHNQDHNGLVEKRWEVLTNMARAFLADA